MCGRHKADSANILAATFRGSQAGAEEDADIGTARSHKKWGHFATAVCLPPPTLILPPQAGMEDSSPSLLWPKERLP